MTDRVTNRLCLDCGSFLNSDDMALNSAGLWCVKHELERRAGIEKGFKRPATVETRAPSGSQVRFGKERGMPWVDTQSHDHSYLSKPIRWSDPEPTFALCKASGKRRSAENMLAHLIVHGNAMQVPSRAYHCTACDGWHLTSDGFRAKAPSPTPLDPRQPDHAGGHI